jgi:serine/threonine protein kinase
LFGASAHRRRDPRPGQGGGPAACGLSGRPPFEGDKPIKVIVAHASEEVLPPSRHRAEIPDDLERVILRCLAKPPADRFQDAASLAEALAGCRAADDWPRHLAAQWWQQQPLSSPPPQHDARRGDSSGIAVSDRTRTPYNGS